MPDEDEQLRILCSLRGQMITGVDLGETDPHLLLTLEDGRVFFLCGSSDQYESWQCGIAWGDPHAPWLVVATPGGDLAFWAPNGFTDSEL
jgi:hypothetical protein